MLRFIGGPKHGDDVVLEEGWPAPAKMSHRDYAELGHYHRGEEGDYHWVDSPMPRLTERRLVQ